MRAWPNMTAIVMCVRQRDSVGIYALVVSANIYVAVVIEVMANQSSVNFSKA